VSAVVIVFDAATIESVALSQFSIAPSIALVWCATAGAAVVHDLR
jgi:hypothetical protein